MGDTNAFQKKERFGVLLCFIRGLSESTALSSTFSTTFCVRALKVIREDLASRAFRRDRLWQLVGSFQMFLGERLG